MSTVRIERIKPHIGGIVHIAKEHLLDDQTAAAVREALEDRGDRPAAAEGNAAQCPQAVAHRRPDRIPHGRSLLVRLQEWAAQPAFSYRHQWQQGDLVIWDNCGCMHRVVPYDENSGRMMHRTTLMGEERVA